MSQTTVRMGALALVAMLAGCTVPLPDHGPFTGPGTGGSSGGESSSTGSVAPASTGGDESSTTAEPRLDMGPDPAGCVDCTVTIHSKQSGELALLDDTTFAVGELEGHVVYAIGTFGAGRFIASADIALVLGEQTDCPLHAWLAGSHDPEPAILVFGHNHAVELGEWEFEPRVHMPAEYIGDVGRLQDDFDVVVYLEESEHLDDGQTPTSEELQTALEFAWAGGGLVVSSEYAAQPGGYLGPADLTSVNRLMVPLGVEALPVTHGWGNVSGEIELPCFPSVE